ncbi:MAG: FAD:protein FMN transferase [Chloroflexi bacterium]|nr:FAD:protein FMN transferase [Chloroflexota bacterium]
MLMAAGYDHSFEALTDGAVQPMAHGPIVAGGFGGVRLNVRRRTVQLPDGGGLDLGGIAKGWLADVLAQRLGRYGAALADLGGDIAVGGETDGGSGWEVEISDPFGGDQPLAVLRLRGGGVATSGVLKRRWRSGDGWRHHLIDPRTGRSSESDVAAVTVVAPSAAVAEVAAKAVLLLGATAGAAALEASPEMAGLLVLHDGTAVNTAGFERFCAA